MQRNLENVISLSARFLLLKQQDTVYDKDRAKALKKLPLHIYLICRSPKIMLDVGKSTITPTQITLTFFTNVQGVRKDIVVKTINRKHQPIESIECDYPNNFYKAYGPKKSFHSEGKTNLLFKYLTAQNGKYYNESNLEVLYVGQAFSKKGKRITVDRLEKHEKAQKIYFDTQNRFPDYEVWFLSLTFEPSLMTVFDPKTFYNPSQFEDDLEHLNKVESTPISFDQQITILEAAMISYFGTAEFNKEYLDFPSSKHTSYSELYDLDFNSVGFELTTVSIHSQLFSKTVPANFTHYKTFFLHNQTQRKEVLYWLKGDE
ncbi:hypothetical protein KJK34_10380 [Flavobacterium sp. D11R37]|jgi:hypothetical protein|uniref:hypothetical protein n=1 Tax=Flavobacterium coralii TaxID=2838017 RepID=UPI001CA671F0|nr:hypothetical protein [Flavobacterium coralii]MBY8963158.1 hypothetical protein [Flavobacterium coralii]